MLNENFRSPDQEEAGKEFKYFTSKKERFKGKNIPLEQGSGTIPPEIEYLISQARDADGNFLSNLENIKISDERLRESSEKHDAYRKANPDIKVKPRIIYGSVARKEAKKESDTDETTTSAFLHLHIALFAPFEIIGADEKEINQISSEIEQKREQEILDFLKKYKGEMFSSADAIIDYVEANAMISRRAQEKKQSPEAEEAKLVQSIMINFIETLNKLVDKGRLKKYGFHQYQLKES